MKKYVCDACGWEYDEAVGDAELDIAPGTKFEDLPDDFEKIAFLFHTAVTFHKQQVFLSSVTPSKYQNQAKQLQKRNNKRRHVSHSRCS